ncbi:MAG: hypothetical protein NTW87_31900, partial [Planctomycetota bacterium]|nr:hypothetical protein [Planctomycetota bacterium]
VSNTLGFIRCHSASARSSAVLCFDDKAPPQLPLVVFVISLTILKHTPATAAQQSLRISHTAATSA